jgi:hypothetical protein
MNIENAELARVASELPDITTFAGIIAANVQDADTEKEAVLFLGRIKDNTKSLESQLSFLTKPLKDHVKAIKAEFDRLINPLEAADKTVRDAITAWRNSPEFKELEAKRLAIENHAREAVRDNDVEKLEVLSGEHLNAANLAPKMVKTNEGNMSMRKNIRIEITDMEQIPKAYLLVNEAAIKAAIKDGFEVPGIRHWIEMTPIISN